MKGLLLQQRNRQGEIVLAENWQTKQQGNFPARNMNTILMYNLDDECVERVTLSEEELKNLKISDDEGTPIPFENLFAKIGTGKIAIVESLVTANRKGNIIIESVEEIKGVDVWSIDR